MIALSSLALTFYQTMATVIGKSIGIKIDPYAKYWLAVLQILMKTLLLMITSSICVLYYDINVKYDVINVILISLFTHIVLTYVTYIALLLLMYILDGDGNCYHCIGSRNEQI